jgi:hypothetical protein
MSDSQTTEGAFRRLLESSSRSDFFSNKESPAEAFEDIWNLDSNIFVESTQQIAQRWHVLTDLLDGFLEFLASSHDPELFNTVSDLIQGSRIRTSAKIKIRWVLAMKGERSSVARLTTDCSKQITQLGNRDILSMNSLSPLGDLLWTICTARLMGVSPSIMRLCQQIPTLNKYIPHHIYYRLHYAGYSLGDCSNAAFADSTNRSFDESRRSAAVLCLACSRDITLLKMLMQLYDEEMATRRSDGLIQHLINAIGYLAPYEVMSDFLGHQIESHVPKALRGGSYDRVIGELIKACYFAQKLTTSVLKALKVIASSSCDDLATLAAVTLDMHKCELPQTDVEYRSKMENEKSYLNSSCRLGSLLGLRSVVFKN